MDFRYAGRPFLFSVPGTTFLVREKMGKKKNYLTITPSLFSGSPNGKIANSRAKMKRA